MDSPWLLLKLLLFFTILTTGASLKCETCYGAGKNCSGTMESCKTDETTCIVSYTMDIIDGVSVDETTKGCGHLYRCSFPPIHFDMGPKLNFRSHWTCCKGGECKAVSVTLPALQTNKNGKKCPVCHEWSDSCKSKMMDCAGEDRNCFEMASHVKLPNGSHIDRTMMGCTDKFVCDTIESERSRFWFGSDNIQKARCDTIHSRGCRLTSLLLPPFSALLLMKIFM